MQSIAISTSVSGIADSKKSTASSRRASLSFTFATASFEVAITTTLCKNRVPTSRSGPKDENGGGLTPRTAKTAWSCALESAIVGLP